MKKYRVLLLLGSIFSCLFSMNLIYGSILYFRNMYSESLVYEINIYAQVVSNGLLALLFLLLLIKKSRPYQFIIVGSLISLLNVIAMIFYTSIVQDFYFNIYALRGLVLLLIGINLRSNRLDIVRKLSLYFFVELLIIQVYSTSDDSIFFMHKTFEANILGTMLMLVLGLFIPLSLSYLLTDEKVSLESKVRKPVNISSVLRVSSIISIVYLCILIIMTFPFLFAVLVDANRLTIVYYRFSALLRIVLFSLLIYAFISLIRENVKQWIFPVITIVTIVTVMFPLTINLQFFFDRFHWFYGVSIDLFILVLLAVFVYLEKHTISFYLSIWFVLNLLLVSLGIGNLQSMIIFNNIPIRSVEILLQIGYYFIPISLILALYNRMKTKNV